MKKRVLMAMAALAFAVTALGDGEPDHSIPETYIRAATWSQLYNATNDLNTAIRSWVDTHKWTWASITNKPTTWAWSALTGIPSWIGSSKPSYSWSEITSKPTTWAWSAISGKPSWIGDNKPTYSYADVGALPRNMNNIYSGSGLITEYLLGVGNTEGGIRINFSSLNNHTDSTYYGYNGVKVNRSGVDEWYMWDTTTPTGIVRRSELASYKPKQTAKTSPTASGNTYQFIDTISQDTNGVITATKKSVRTASTSQTGIVQLSSATNSTSTSLAATPSAVKAVRDEVGSLAASIPDWAKSETPPISEESDPTIALTNGTIYVHGDTITPLTSHQSLSGYVPTTRTINGKALSANISLTAANVGAATPLAVTNIVRDLSLGGIWDEALEVWWTPRMSGGSLTYHATTNVNMNAGN